MLANHVPPKDFIDWLMEDQPIGPNIRQHILDKLKASSYKITKPIEFEAKIDMEDMKKTFAGLDELFNTFRPTNNE